MLCLNIITYINRFAAAICIFNKTNRVTTKLYLKCVAVGSLKRFDGLELGIIRGFLAFWLWYNGEVYCLRFQSASQ